MVAIVFCLLMNTITWNVRGLSSKVLPSIVKDFKCFYRCDMLVILEPRISGPRVESVIKKLGFDKYAVVEATGFSWGI